MHNKLQNKKLSSEDFFNIQKEVLQQWPTGKDVDFNEAVEYHRKLPASKSFSGKLAEAKINSTTLIQPRAGVALPERHIELLRFLEDEGEADLLPTTIDSYTRLNRYKEAETGIEESKTSGRSMLNGFPAVNYGVSICRNVTGAVKNPV